MCLLTTDVVDAPLFRLDLEPTTRNGLEERSQIMIDKIVALRRNRIASRIGALDQETVVRLNRSLALFLGLGD